VARAAAGLRPREGIEIIKNITNRERESTSPRARLNDLYDLETLRPREEFLAHYRKFTRIFQDMGLDYPTWD
jgi:hypothetical protein